MLMSKMSKKLLVFFLGLLYFCQTKVQAYCNSDELDACLKGTVFEGAGDNALTENGLFPKMDDVKLNDVCMEYQQVSRCWQPILANCQTAIQQMFESVDNLYNYLCGPGKQKYLRNHECLSSDSLVNAGKDCLHTFEKQMERVKSKINWGSIGREQAKDMLCSHMTSFKSCIADDALTYCNKEASEVMEELTTEMLKPIRATVECGRLSTKIIIAIIGAVVFTIVLICTIAYLIWKKRVCCGGNRSKRSNPPPAYTSVNYTPGNDYLGHQEVKHADVKDAV